MVSALMVTGAFGLAGLAGQQALVEAAPPVFAVERPVEAAAQARIVTSGSLADMESALVNIYKTVNPSVVFIQVTSDAQILSLPFFGPNRNSGQPAQQALGSGFVWDKKGNIVTNNHVIVGASTVDVTFADGTTVPAKVIGADGNSDLAVIKVNVSPDRLQPVSLADSTKVQVGQMAIAIGNPFGERNTMTTGIISALGRSLPINETDPSSPAYAIPDVIQTDAPINPGNSGGVLLNLQGQVIGITAAMESPTNASSGIGFAVPSVIVKKVVPALIATGHYNHSWLGISGMAMNSEVAKAMGLSANQRGVLVTTVISGSPAAHAGLKGGGRAIAASGEQAKIGGDVIIAIDSHPIVNFDDLTTYLVRSTGVGQAVTLSIVRNGSQQTVNVTLQARPHSQPPSGGQ
jgi:serine protease Do